MLEKADLSKVRADRWWDRFHLLLPSIINSHRRLPFPNTTKKDFCRCVTNDISVSTTTTHNTTHRTNHTMVSPALATIVATSLARGGSSVLESGAVAVAATSSANHGTTPSSLYDKFHAHTPEPLRFFCSANSGNAVLYVLERVFFALLQDKTLPGMLNQQKGSVSFFLAYLFHVVPQHFFLAFFVYGLHTMSTKEKYWRTLRGTYQT